jgi:Na+/H+ antiporter NhaD/arsenite permease-like protein
VKPTDPFLLQVKSKNLTDYLTKQKWNTVLIPILWFFLSVSPCLGSGETDGSGPADILVVSGIITNTQGKGVKDAVLRFFSNGKKIETEREITTERDGTYEAEIRLPAGTLFRLEVNLEVNRPSYEGTGKVPLGVIIREQTDEMGVTTYLAHKNFVLKRVIGPAFWIATLVLILIYGLIAFEVVHRTLAALLGAAMILFVTYTAGAFHPGYFILSFEDAIHAIDLNVIFLLMGMMMIVGVLKRTGLFQWLAFKSFQLARGNIFALAIILMFITAVTSSFLDNVTTMILIIPVTINIASVLGINPVTLLLPEVFASNVGGTATLIGDPPNIMIGSYANLTFLDFVAHLTFVCLISLAVTMVYFLYWYKKDYLKARITDVKKTVNELRGVYKITDRVLLFQSVSVLGITIFLFIVHGALHMEPSIAAMTGAAILLLVSRVKIVEILKDEIEWATLTFFMTLFIIVAGAEETGLIQIIADWVHHVSRGSLVMSVLVILWVSALASAIIDNIPFTATMLPIVAYLTQAVPGAQGGILWWALALGACLGGNGTMIGASANVVTVGIAESCGYRISFMKYFKIAFIPMIITIVLSSIWLLLVEM